MEIELRGGLVLVASLLGSSSVWLVNFAVSDPRSQSQSVVSPPSLIP